jgi:CheY-like chemotaxis protein
VTLLKKEPFRRALVVDDDPLVLETVVSVPEELGCESIPARSGSEALGQLARDQTVQILVADINMPGLSGVQLAERACAFRPELRVLLLSVRKSDGRGFHLLKKPFSQPDLRRTMAEIISLLRLRRGGLRRMSRKLPELVRRT